MRKSRTRKGTRGGMGPAAPVRAPYAPAPVKAAAPRTPASTAPAQFEPATAPRTPAPYAPAPYAPAQNNIAGTMERHARNAGSRVATAARRIFSDWLGGSRTKRRGGTKKQRVKTHHK